MEIHKFTPPTAGKIAEALVTARSQSAEIQVGTAFLPKGTRVPAEGLNAYPNHEISFLLEGCIEGEVNGAACRFNAGDVVHMIPNETQWGIAVEDTLIYYIFFGDTGAD
jgi:quercetin dioxygenase-like cupin family protein